MEENCSQKRHIPWNKGKFGYMKANRTSITAETVKRSDYKTPHLTSRDGFIITAEDEFVMTQSRNGKVYKHHKRIPFAKHVLMQAGIEVPKGHVVYHIDGDKLNNDLSNLEVISRAELMRRNHPGRYAD